MEENREGGSEGSGRREGWREELGGSEGGSEGRKGRKRGESEGDILAASRLAPTEGRRSQSDRHHLPRTRIENI